MQDRLKQVPETIRRNVQQVIQLVMQKGFQQQQNLINQYLTGQKLQYQFLLPKSRYYKYYTQQLSYELSDNRQRKVPTVQKKKQTVFISGTVQDVSAGAMCQLIKQLRQNQQPYQPFDNQIYEQQIEVNFHNQNHNKKVQSIIDLIQNMNNPKKQTVQTSNEKTIGLTKTDLLRNQLGTQKDGSMGGWGGKKYQGLGKNDQFSNYRKNLGKSFYSSNMR